MSQANTKYTIKLTEQVINSLKTDAGGFTRCSLQALGLQYPLREGWAKTLIGSEISPTAYALAMAGRNELSKNKHKHKHKSKLYINRDSLATEKQLRYLLILGVDEDDATLMTVAQATERIHLLRDKPTPRQLSYAKALGASDIELMEFTRSTIGAFIDSNKKHKAVDYAVDNSPY